uniref:Uncharacterized protein n=1 Tax=Cucumis melo TaxID=3656 RepID=A0A9I9DJH3_CUCME
MGDCCGNKMEREILKEKLLVRKKVVFGKTSLNIARFLLAGFFARLRHLSLSLAVSNSNLDDQKFDESF